MATSSSFAFTGSVEVGYGCLDEVAAVVVFVHAHVGPALVHAGEGVVGVDIAIRALGGGDFFDPLVGFLFQFGTGVVVEGVGDGFQGFEDIGVVVKDTLELAFPHAGSDFEVSDARRLDFGLFDAHRDGDGGYFFKPWLPKSVFDTHLGKANGFEALRYRLCKGAEAGQEEKSKGKKAHNDTFLRVW